MKFLKKSPPEIVVGKAYDEARLTEHITYTEVFFNRGDLVELKITAEDIAREQYTVNITSRWQNASTSIIREYGFADYDILGLKLNRMEFKNGTYKNYYIIRDFLRLDKNNVTAVILEEVLTGKTHSVETLLLAQHCTVTNMEADTIKLLYGERK